MWYIYEKPKINQNFWFFINLKYISQHPQKLKTIPKTTFFFIIEYLGLQTTKKTFLLKISNFEKSSNFKKKGVRWYMVQNM